MKLEEISKELENASNLLCDTALVFTGEENVKDYPEWNSVYNVGCLINEISDKLKNMMEGN